MKPILLIWDIDGTLMSSKSIGRRAMNNAFKQLHNIDDGFKSIDMAGRIDYHIISDAYKYHQIDKVQINDFYNAYKQQLEELIKKDDSAHILSGVSDILEDKVEKERKQ